MLTTETRKQKCYNDVKRTIVSALVVLLCGNALQAQDYFVSSPEGNYSVEYWKDGKKADTVPSDCDHKTATVSLVVPAERLAYEVEHFRQGCAPIHPIMFAATHAELVLYPFLVHELMRTVVSVE